MTTPTVTGPSAAAAGATSAPPLAHPSRPDSRRRRGARAWAPWLLGAPIILLLAFVALVLLLLGVEQQRCMPGGALPDFSGPGSLGGIAGTGLTAAQLQAVRAGSPYAGDHVVAGRYVSSAYGPPWGGIQGAGQQTSGGLVITGGAPRFYVIAVDPLLVAHGNLVYLWPNPFGWRGPFLAADTGLAIKGRRIDFYDWRGRLTQRRWARREITLSRHPIVPGGPDITSTQPLAGGCELPASSAVGERIGQLARAQLGRGPRIPGFQPPAVNYAWCAWFATNVWHNAGVPIPVDGWSGYPYTWAHAKGLLFKQIGEPPRSSVPPVGSALMYGTDAAPGGDSRHVNLIDRVLPDGSLMVTGGNQDTHRVTRYGPCRLQATDPARLTGPGCDPRPIYGIAMPSSEA